MDIMNEVFAMREDRGGLIQTPEQYAFIYKCVSLYTLAISAEELPPAYTHPPVFTADEASDDEVTAAEPSSPGQDALPAAVMKSLDQGTLRQLHSMRSR